MPRLEPPASISSASRAEPRRPGGLGRVLAGLLLCLLGVGGCATARYDYRSEPDPTRAEYILGPGDIVEVRQWKNPDVSGRLRILPDGSIAVPLLGQVQAAGLTVKELRAAVEKGLAKYIAPSAGMPTLTVAVDEFQGYAVSVLGEVNQPGHYQPGHYVTVLEALALAHGLTAYAREDRITILRRGRPGQPERRIPIAYSTLSKGGRPEMNLYLLRGDVIVVP